MADGDNIFTITGRGLNDFFTQIGDPVGWGQAQAAEDARGTQGNLDRLTAGVGRLMPSLQAAAQRRQASNPYSSAVADQSRAAQMALINQMRQQMSGPSMAAMQGQRAMGQMNAAALGGAAGRPMAARAAMLQQGQAGAGMANELGQARLAEVLRAQAAMGGAAGNLRGADLRSAEAQMQAGLRAQDAADQNSRFYAQQGTALNEAGRRGALDYYKYLQRLAQTRTDQARQTGKDVASTAGTVLDIVL